MTAAELKVSLNLTAAKFRELLDAGLPHTRRGRARVFEAAAVRDWLIATGRARERHLAATLNDVARHFGVDVRTIHNWKNNGMPGEPPYDLDAIAAWRSSRGQCRPDEDAAAARKAEAQAQLMEARLQKVRGELLDFETVRRLFVRHITEAGTILEQLPDRIAAILPVDCPSKDGWAELRKSVRENAEGVVHSSRQTLADLLVAKEIRPKEER